MKIVIIVQARIGSTRLPGKVMLPILGKPLLLYLIERLKKVKNCDEIVIATTDKKIDDTIAGFCEAQGLFCFRGEEEDVLKRFRDASLAFEAGVVVRITADCPLIDPMVVEKVIQFYLDNSFDYVGNTLILTYPRGMDTEVFSREVLFEAFDQATLKEEREHVTLFIYRHPEIFKLANVAYLDDRSYYRLTVDTQEDFILIKNIIENLYPLNPHFNLEDIIKLLEENPTLAKINSHIPQKPIKEV